MIFHSLHDYYFYELCLLTQISETLTLFQRLTIQLLSFVSDLVPKHVPILIAVEPPELSNSYAFDAPCSELFKVFSVKEKVKSFMATFIH